MSQSFTPSDEELNQAVEERNALLLSQYALSFERARREQGERIPSLLEKAANANRELDICKAVIKSHESSIKLIQSVLRTLRP